MKNNTIRMFLALGAACVGGSALDAQTSQQLLSAKVPFAFQVPGRAFEAGKYVVREHGHLGQPSLQNAATGQAVFVIGAAHSLAPVGPPRLVFHCYTGNACFLAEIRPWAGEGDKVAMTKAEKEFVNGGKSREMATISIALRNGD